MGKPSSVTGFDETAHQAPPPDANAFPADDPTTPRPDDEQPPPPRTAAELGEDADAGGAAAHDHQ